MDQDRCRAGCRFSWSDSARLDEDATAVGKHSAGSKAPVRSSGAGVPQPGKIFPNRWSITMQRLQVTPRRGCQPISRLVTQTSAPMEQREHERFASAPAQNRRHRARFHDPQVLVTILETTLVGV